MLTTTVLAQMMDRGDMDGGGHWWAWLIGVVVLVLIVVLIVFVVMRMSAPSAAAPRSDRPSAEDLLAERFARGEIDEDEYRRRRDALRG